MIGRLGGPLEQTGTLTESDIDLAAAIPIHEGELRHPVAEMETLPESHPLLTVMSTCHSLIRLKENLSGYSIDRKMFEATGWVRTLIFGIRRIISRGCSLKKIPRTPPKKIRKIRKKSENSRIFFEDLKSVHLIWE